MTSPGAPSPIPIALQLSSTVLVTVQSADARPTREEMLVLQQKVTTPRWDKYLELLQNDYTEGDALDVVGRKGRDGTVEPEERGAYLDAFLAVGKRARLNRRDVARGERERGVGPYANFLQPCRARVADSRRIGELPLEQVN